MKRDLKYIGLVLLIVSTVLHSCKKEENDNTVTDIDGNKYTSVSIGTQIWLVENLKTTKCNDGAQITGATDNTIWANLSTPSYCWYNNDTSNKDAYGALYNWYAVNTGNLCPAGWHVPTYADIYELASYIGFTGGGKLKEFGTMHWLSPNTGATNGTGFTALPGGLHYASGAFDSMGVRGEWWWIPDEPGYQGMLSLVYESTDILSGYGNYEETRGASVRCLKD
jgi:uncharacterized protein (TIGR02145 family)